MLEMGTPPWEGLDWIRRTATTASEHTTAGDFGVLFGDAAGDVTIERSHWSNHSVNFTSDVPGAAMAYPNFWGTLEFR